MSSDAVRRILAEVREFIKINSAPNRFFYAAPLESDLFEWHFSVRGPPDTVFAEGVYHGRILLPAEYPLKAPEIIMLTPNGRFEVGKRICLSVTSHHQETWQPSWGIRTILTALVGFMPSKAEGVGALDYPDEDRLRLARKSRFYKCPRCGAVPYEQLPPLKQAGSSSSKDSGASSSDDTRSSQSNVNNENLDETRESPNDESSLENESLEDTDSSAEDPNISGTDEVEAVDVTRSTNASDEIANESTESDNTRDGLTTENDEDANGHDDADEITPVVDSIPSNRRQGAHHTSTQAEVNTGHNNGEAERTGVQEKELLYLAYAIVAMMLAVVVRRIINIVAS